MWHAVIAPQSPVLPDLDSEHEGEGVGSRLQLKVSDRIRTGDRLDHNPSERGRLRLNSLL
jgi:hypothetical protein